MDSIIPVREPTSAERYEIHQRWAHQGGGFMPGPRLTPPPAGYYVKPSGVQRSKFEDDAYHINSSISVIMMLYHHLDELLKDDFSPSE